MMSLFRSNREHLNEQLRHKADQVSDRLSEEVEQVRRGLHRRPLTGGGEWDYVDPAKRNLHQKVAANTNGFATLANGLSLTGAALTATGMYKAFVRRDYIAGTKLMGIGRNLDIIDGTIAQKTGTCSDKGAAIDAGFDKVLTAGFLALATLSGDLPATEAVAHGLQQARIFRENFLIKNAGGEPNPSREGKRGMTALWLRAGGLVLAPALEQAGHDRAAAVIERASQACGMLALYYNQEAIDGYTAEREALQAQFSQETQ